MAIHGLPPVANSASMASSVSEWAGRLVAPLGASLLSKDGMMELAGRVYWIVALVIAAVVIFAAKNGYLVGRVTTPEPSSNTSSGVTPSGSDEKFSGSLAQQLTASNTVSGVAPRGSATNASGAVEKSFVSSQNSLLTSSLSLGAGFNPLARPNIEILIETLEGDVEKIHQNFEQCLKDLQGCKPGSLQFQELIVDFKQKTANFHKVYGPYQRALNPTCYMTVKHYEVILTDINDILRGIIRVKGDGNCLFHSFVEAFKRLQPYLMQAQVWDDRFLDHRFLRFTVNEFMQNNFESDADLKRLIDDAIIAHVEAKKTDIPLQKESEQWKLSSAEQLKAEGFEIDEAEVKLRLKKLEEEETSLLDFEGPNKYKLYFTKFEELGFFAAFAAAYSMCKILKEKIGIRVAVEPERQITAEYDAFNVNAPILITLIFKGDHFDVKFPEGFLG